MKSIYFNSQPHEEADPLAIFAWFSWSYFNSQPHEEADNFSTDGSATIGISTHSLTKRLTKTLVSWQTNWKISTHSLTKRLTEIAAALNVSGLYFNSQPHEEADGHEKLDTTMIYAFQLTASRRGWRRLMKRRMWLLHYFNSQPHEEADWPRVV